MKLGFYYSTPERDLPAGKAFRRPTEACDSVGARSWGYRANEDYRTVGYCTRLIVHFLSLGGNFLLNVGPKADGTVPSGALSLLMKTFGRAVPLVTAPTAGRQGIYRGANDWTRRAGIDVAGLKRDGFTIVAKDGNV